MVFFSDFPASVGLKHMLKNTSSPESLRFNQEYLERTADYTLSTAEVFLPPKTVQNTMPVYDFINYLLKLNSTQPQSKIIVLTEDHDYVMLKLLASFNIFYLLSKKESLQFIHHTVIESSDVFEQHASPAIIKKIGKRWNNEPLTHRQWFVLNQLAKSLPPAVIGAIWGLHVKTISTHKRNIMKKLGFTSRQFLQLLMMLGEVKEISTMQIKTSSDHEVKPENIAAERECSLTAAF